MRSMCHTIVFVCVCALMALFASSAQASDWSDCDLSTKSPDVVIRACTRVIARKPKDEVHIYYSIRGDAYVAKKAYDRAIEDYSKAINSAPDSAYKSAYYAGRGHIYGWKKNDFDHAILDYSEAIKLNASSIDAYVGRCDVFYFKGQYDRAIADCSEAIRLDPRYHLRRGKVWEAKGEKQKAIDDYTKMVSLLDGATRYQEERDDLAEAKRRLAALQPFSLAAPAPTLIAPEPKLTKPELKPTAPPHKLASEVAPQPSPPVSQLGRRVALAIGNADYRKVDPLPNPRKDASDIAAALKAAGFAEVVVRHDLGLKQMQRALAAFEEKAARAEWAVVYYGGHAIQVDGKNYLVPIDAELKSPSDVEDETLVLDRVLARIAAAGKLRLVILDACRTNPFRRLWATAKPAAGAQAVTRDIAERGLRRYETTQRNLLIAYAAAEGQVALDGRPGENSPYVKALLKHLATPGLEINKLFRLVGDDVMAETGGKQQPFEYGSRSGEDMFFRAASR